jgi:hypothetical protein
MEQAHVTSTNIQTVGYEDKTLFIRFHSGGCYRYDGAPYDCFDALQKVESAGHYFHRFIKGKYRYKKMENDPFLND